jgi:hypothetical protein
MKNYTVGPGDTISGIILREFGIDHALSEQLWDCLIRYVAVINGKDLNLYDNISSGVIADPDSLKPGQILVFPETLEEAYADSRFQQINAGACGNLVNTNTESAPHKMKMWPVYAGLGLLALLLLTKKKKGRK